MSRARSVRAAAASRRRPAADIVARRRRRAVAGLLGVALAFAIAVLAARIAGDSQGDGVLSGAVDELLDGDAVDASSLADALSALDVFEVDETVSLAAFQEEVLSLEDRDELRCDLESGIVGFTVEGEAQEVFAALLAELQDGGWTFEESGSDTYGTFVKSEGAYGWLFVSCVQVGDATCVVVQVDAFEEGEG